MSSSPPSLKSSDIVVLPVDKVYACCGPAYRRILLTRSLRNENKHCAIDFRAGFSWSIAQSEGSEYLGPCDISVFLFL